MVHHISIDKLREAEDPCELLLGQLHKLVYITQLPPSHQRDPRRSLVQKYKKALFTLPFNYLNMKRALRNLVVGSRDRLDLEPSLRENWNGAQRMTYEDLQRTIEQILVETGYYESILDDADLLLQDQKSGVHRSKTPPLPTSLYLTGHGYRSRSATPTGSIPRSQDSTSQALPLSQNHVPNPSNESESHWKNRGIKVRTL